MKSKAVFWAAKRIVRDNWVPNCAVDVATRKAVGVNGITNLWQKHLCQQQPRRYNAEYVVSGLNEKIDLVDLIDAVAYELKVSSNNPHHEFYRDIFKVWIHNSRSKSKIKKLYFITPDEGACKLSRGLAAAVVERDAKLGFSIDVVAI